MPKRKKHVTQADELELNQFEFRRIMGDAWPQLHRFVHGIFCTCPAEEKNLVDYKVFLNELNDIILKGYCSSCGEIASRYIEIGERPESKEIADSIRSRGQ